MFSLKNIKYHKVKCNKIKNVITQVPSQPSKWIYEVHPLKGKKIVFFCVQLYLNIYKFFENIFRFIKNNNIFDIIYTFVYFYLSLNLNIKW